MSINLLLSYQFRDASWVWEKRREGMESLRGEVADGAKEVLDRFEDRLKYYDFRANGFEIIIDQICFPVNGSDTMHFIKKALAVKTF
jgi:hypothetical protein